MLVGVDASRAIRARRTGTEGYSFELLSALVRRSEERRYRLYFDCAPPTDFPRGEGAEFRVIAAPRLWTHYRLAREVAIHPPDLLFVPSHVIPVRCAVPAVATIHDVGYLWYKSAYSPLAWILLHLGTIHNARVARRIIADSQATASDLVKHFHVDPKRIRVASLGAPQVADVTFPEGLRERYGLESPYFLFVGTQQPRKNLGRLLEAFAQVRRRNHRVTLAIAGPAGIGVSRLRERAAAIGLEGSVRWLGYVPRADIAPLYAGASAFVFPSLYEGFGLPVLEAMAWGAPVIASSTSSLPEVVGDAGLLVDPLDVAGLAQAMIRVLEDADLGERLRRAGREQVSRFSWDRCAQVVEAAFDEALS